MQTVRDLEYSALNVTSLSYHSPKASGYMCKKRRKIIRVRYSELLPFPKSVWLKPLLPTKTVSTSTRHKEIQTIKNPRVKREKETQSPISNQEAIRN